MSEHKSLAGALILAHGTRDGQALLATLHAVQEHGKPAEVMLALAATAADLLIELCGDDWQAALQHALLEVNADQ